MITRIQSASFRKKGRKRLARTRGRGDQHMFGRPNGWPCLCLRGGWARGTGGQTRPQPTDGVLKVSSRDSAYAAQSAIIARPAAEPIGVAPRPPLSPSLSPGAEREG